MIIIIIWQARRKALRNLNDIPGETRRIIKKPTTLAPQIEKVLAQIYKDTPPKNNDTEYQSLVMQLKEIFHTSSTTVCSKCSKV